MMRLPAGLMNVPFDQAIQIQSSSVWPAARVKQSRFHEEADLIVLILLIPMLIK